LVQLDETEHVLAEDRNNIQSSKWAGDLGATVDCTKISKGRYWWNVFAQSKRAGLGLAVLFVGFFLAYLNAALQKDGTIEWQLGLWRWVIFVLTAATAVVLWIRDTWM
jgi:hypothetical protein